jgi:hypothetical protein
LTYCVLTVVSGNTLQGRKRRWKKLSRKENEKLIDALYLIREICSRHSVCTDCPIYNDGHNQCELMMRKPYAWDLTDEIDDNWRAFVQ